MKYSHDKYGGEHEIPELSRKETIEYNKRHKGIKEKTVSFGQHLKSMASKMKNGHYVGSKEHKRDKMTGKAI